MVSLIHRSALIRCQNPVPGLAHTLGTMNASAAPPQAPAQYRSPYCVDHPARPLASKTRDAVIDIVSQKKVLEGKQYRRDSRPTLLRKSALYRDGVIRTAQFSGLLPHRKDVHRQPDIVQYRPHREPPGSACDAGARGRREIALRNQPAAPLPGLRRRSCPTTRVNQG